MIKRNGMLLKMIRKRRSGINTYAICDDNGTPKMPQINDKGHVVTWNILLINDKNLN